MHRFFVCILSLLLSAATLPAGAPAFTARWNFSAATREAGSWKTDHSVADNAGTATLSFEGVAPVYGYNKSSSVTVSHIVVGDSFVFSAPVEGGLPKGTDIDLGVYIQMDKEGTSAWTCEYYDGRRWRGTGLGLTISKGPHDNETTFLGTFTLAKPFKGAEFKARLRCTAISAPEETRFSFRTGIRRAALFAAWPEGGEPLRVLMLGNSYTFYGASHFDLVEIAHSQGHRLDVGVNVKGGQNLGQHLGLTRSRAAIAAGGYEAALLQNQSQGSAYYASDPERYLYIRDYCVAMAAEVREYSPDCRLILEWTWGSPKNDWAGHGSAEAHDALLEEGTKVLAAEMGADISPIGRAFILGRAAGLSLYDKDDFHQNETGAYLKACVNYLVLFGGTFDANVSDCGLDPETAARCREMALKAVQP
jgi:hypothetical protein